MKICLLHVWKYYIYDSFHQGLYCLLGKKDLQTKDKQTLLLNTITRHPKACTVAYPKFIASNQKERSICIHSKLLELRSGQLVIY